MPRVKQRIHEFEEESCIASSLPLNIIFSIYFSKHHQFRESRHFCSQSIASGKRGRNLVHNEISIKKESKMVIDNGFCLTFRYDFHD